MSIFQQFMTNYNIYELRECTGKHLPKGCQKFHLLEGLQEVTEIHVMKYNKIYNKIPIN